METVKDFYKAIKVEADHLDKFYQRIFANRKEEMLREWEENSNIEWVTLLSEEQKENLQQYRIKVHSMKSSANTIGAIVLGGMAKILENAAQNADIHIIGKLHSIFLTEWQSYSEKFEILFPPKEKTKISQDTMKLTANLEILQQALEELWRLLKHPL